MIYFCLNKSGLLDPLIETLYEKYFNTCVVFWNQDAKDKIKRAPFFSDKWLLVIDARDLLSKENKFILENRFVDILCEVSTDDEFNKVFVHCDSVIDEFCTLCSKTSNRLMKDWNVSKEELEQLLEHFKKMKYLNSYKLSEKYLETYVKWFLFTREGNQYGSKEKMTSGERWQRAVDLELTPVEDLNLKYLTKLIKGNEARLLTALNLMGLDILNLEFLMNSEEYFPKPKYVTVNNFPLYLFSKDRRKKKEIMNIVYSYRHNPGLLKRSLLDFCDTFEQIYKAFSCGELSVKNRDSWFSSKGYELKINSNFKATLWWRCVNTISLERIYIIRSNLSKSSFKVYEYTVELCRKELE